MTKIIIEIKPDKENKEMVKNYFYEKCLYLKDLMEIEKFEVKVE